MNCLSSLFQPRCITALDDAASCARRYFASRARCGYEPYTSLGDGRIVAPNEVSQLDIFASVEKIDGSSCLFAWVTPSVAVCRSTVYTIDPSDARVIDLTTISKSAHSRFFRTLSSPLPSWHIVYSRSPSPTSQPLSWAHSGVLVFSARQIDSTVFMKSPSSMGSIDAQLMFLRRARYRSYHRSDLARKPATRANQLFPRPASSGGSDSSSASVPVERPPGAVAAPSTRPEVGRFSFRRHSGASNSS